MGTPNQDDLILDRYQLQREVGRGATGKVYAALDTHLNREVAIKVLDRRLVRERDLRTRFEREIRVTSTLQHPGIVTVFESGTVSGEQPCYVMTLVTGQPMDVIIDRLREDKDHWRTFSLTDRITLFLKLLDVMAYAHSEDVMHRDLKPANIFVGSFGEVWVLDWGLARYLKDERELGPESESAYDDLFGSPERQPKPGEETVISTSTELDPGTASEPNQSGLTRPHGSVSGMQTPYVSGTSSNYRVRTPLPDELVLPIESPTTPHPGRKPPATEAQTRISNRLNAIDVDEHRPSTTALGKSSGHTARRGDTSRVIRTDRRGARTSSLLTSSSRRLNSVQSRVDRHTHLGEVLGSPAYMSPEQARGDANAADRRTDIYSLGVILFELLTLCTPAEMATDEKLPQFLKRVLAGDRRNLRDLWPEAPIALHNLCERALAVEIQDRYNDCDSMARDLRNLLAQLSASYSELERQRLEREREGAWTAAGSWDFAATPGLGPFSEAPRAYEAEPVGQVMHPELGGLLIGGWGLQVYPLSIDVGNDLRIVIEAEVVRGSEFWIFLRGVPPAPCYQFRIGAFGGRWLAIARCNGDDELLDPELLTLRPLRRGSTTAIDQLRKVRLHHLRITIEVVGSRLQVSLDDHPPLVVQDTCPISGPLSRQLALGSFESHAVVRQLTIEQRSAPLMVPAFTVANELLRQNLFPQAIDLYRTFLADHPESELAIEADFMLCLAFLRAGHTAQAERELRLFLSDNLEHGLAQDAIFELARLVLEQSGSIDKAVRVVLSYQEAGDFVRSRFSLLLLPHLRERVHGKGLTPNLMGDLERVRLLIRGSPDEELILATLSQELRFDAQRWANQQFDLDAEVEIDAHRRASERLSGLGFHLAGGQRRTQVEYDRLAARLRGRDDLAEIGFFLHFGSTDPIELGDLVRDILSLLDRDCGQLLLRAMSVMELRPLELVLRAIVAQGIGVAAAAQDDLDTCFRLTDVLETDRSDPHVLYAARLGCYGLGFLPWQLVWDTLSQGSNDHVFLPIAALAATLAETLGNRVDAEQGFQRLANPGTGYLHLAQTGLGRLAAPPAHAD